MTAFIRPSQAQDVFGISRATLYRWAGKGWITIHKRGGCSFVEVDQLKKAITGESDKE